MNKLEELESLGLLKILRGTTAENKDRTQSLGGGSAITVLGLDVYKSTVDLWWDKQLGEGDIESPDMERGKKMEPIVIEWLREHVDSTIQTVPTIQHPEYEWLTGSPDCVGDSGIYEIKCPRMTNVNAIIDEGIKETYFYQCQHYRLIAPLPTTVVVWNYDEWKPYMFEVAPDYVLQAKMMEYYKSFWKCKELGIPPEPWEDEDLQHIEEIPDPTLDSVLERYYINHQLETKSKADKREDGFKIRSALKYRNRILTANYMASKVEKTGYWYFIVRKRNES